MNLKYLHKLQTLIAILFAFYFQTNLFESYSNSIVIAFLIQNTIIKFSYHQSLIYDVLELWNKEKLKYESYK